jgi:hypothetical protein
MNFPCQERWRFDILAYDALAIAVDVAFAIEAQLFLVVVFQNLNSSGYFCTVVAGELRLTSGTFQVRQQRRSCDRSRCATRLRVLRYETI